MIYLDFNFSYDDCSYHHLSAENDDEIKNGQLISSFLDFLRPICKS